ncbi:hypothetical protein A3Q56_03742 [Intoshia linei]|uniref:Uncharacterized protein n=1 Tax=Intoshia linei TaxID=1819745 RepID=A0A177B316_9BILA|nr:hypothetical protein A3Q56_03742 [Intoshia linei]
MYTNRQIKIFIFILTILSHVNYVEANNGNLFNPYNRMISGENLYGKRQRYSYALDNNFSIGTYNKQQNVFHQLPSDQTWFEIYSVENNVYDDYNVHLNTENNHRLKILNLIKFINYYKSRLHKAYNDHYVIHHLIIPKQSNYQF